MLRRTPSMKKLIILALALWTAIPVSAARVQAKFDLLRGSVAGMPQTNAVLRGLKILGEKRIEASGVTSMAELFADIDNVDGEAVVPVLEFSQGREVEGIANVVNYFETNP